MEKDREPGSARFGNFINYYQFNPPDRRLELIPRTLLKLCCSSDHKKTILALDIGCNTGDLTVALHHHLTCSNGDHKPCCDGEHKPCYDGHHQTCCDGDFDLKMLGIDCDAVLIERGNSQHCTVVDGGKVVFQVGDVMCSADRQSVIMDFLRRHSTDMFDIVFVSSVTMWIHLNHGDDGLQELLRFVASVTRNLLLEPQPWRCYKTAVRRMRKLSCQPFKHFDDLIWRENVEQEIVEFLKTECSMKQLECFGQTHNWNRTMHLLTKSI